MANEDNHVPSDKSFQNNFKIISLSLNHSEDTQVDLMIRELPRSTTYLTHVPKKPLDISNINQDTSINNAKNSSSPKEMVSSNPTKTSKSPHNGKPTDISSSTKGKPNLLYATTTTTRPSTPLLDRIRTDGP